MKMFLMLNKVFRLFIDSIRKLNIYIIIIIVPCNYSVGRQSEDGVPC